MPTHNKLRTILLVEDVEEIRDAAAELLISDGYNVAAARDEEDAVLRAKQQVPSILLINLPGPYIGVLQIALRIRERAALSKDIPILIFGADTISEGAELEMSGNILVTSPDNFDELRESIRRLLNWVSFSGSD
jgi:DNA-binding response OmpR family regulator